MQQRKDLERIRAREEKIDRSEDPKSSSKCLKLLLSSSKICTVIWDIFMYAVVEGLKAISRSLKEFDGPQNLDNQLLAIQVVWTANH